MICPCVCIQYEDLYCMMQLCFIFLLQHEDDSFISNESNHFVQDPNGPLKVKIAPKLDSQDGYFVQLDSSSGQPLKCLHVTQMQMTTLFNVRVLDS